MELTSYGHYDDYMANEINYSTNYTRKELDRIADYYEISKRKKKKDEIIQDIVIFEQDPEISKWCIVENVYGLILKK